MFSLHSTIFRGRCLENKWAINTDKTSDVKNGKPVRSKPTIVARQCFKKLINPNDTSYIFLICLLNVFPDLLTDIATLDNVGPICYSAMSRGCARLLPLLLSTGMLLYLIAMTEAVPGPLDCRSVPLFFLVLQSDYNFVSPVVEDFLILKTGGETSRKENQPSKGLHH